jgi:peptidyl-prolyl cis-trans isomerase A (cyclophilin A)
MIDRQLICCACFAILQIRLCTPTLAQSQQGIVRVFMEIELGDIEVEVDVARAPITASNFLKYVDGKCYDGGLFHLGEL